MDIFILAHVHSYAPLIYLVVFLGMVIEGELTVFLASLFVHEHVLAFTPTLILAAIGICLGDFLWFRIGRYLIRHEHRIPRFVRRATGTFDMYLERHPRASIFISKYIYGTHRAVLIRLGMTEMDADSFLRADIPAALAWLAIVGGVAFIGSASLAAFKTDLHYLEIGFALFVALFLSVEIIISPFLKKLLASSRDK